ncbi:adp-ribosylation factor-related protein 1 [Hordeum vulgare]|nr:adp-ribosylation factor-related protein 1 [Hordeum vulgare]
MGLWNYGRKGTHDREAGSLSGRRRGSIQEEAVSPPRQAAVTFSIAPRPAGHRDRQYLNVEIERRRRLLPNDLYYDPRYAADSALSDTWLRDQHDVRRASYFAGTVAGPRWAREVRGRTRVRGLTPASSPSPSSSPPPPPRMTEEEARLIHRVMKDFMTTHDERQWPGLDRAMALSAAGDVAIPEPMEEEEVAAFPPELVRRGAGRAPRRRWRRQWRRELVPHATTVTEAGGFATGGGVASQLRARPRAPGTADPPWTPPPYVDLVSAGDDDDAGDQ